MEFLKLKTKITKMENIDELNSKLNGQKKPISEPEDLVIQIIQVEVHREKG